MNRRPPACKAGALPTELHPQISKTYCEGLWCVVTPKGNLPPRCGFQLRSSTIWLVLAVPRPVPCTAYAAVSAFRQLRRPFETGSGHAHPLHPSTPRRTRRSPYSLTEWLLLSLRPTVLRNTSCALPCNYLKLYRGGLHYRGHPRPLRPFFGPVPRRLLRRETVLSLALAFMPPFRVSCIYPKDYLRDRTNIIVPTFGYTAIYFFQPVRISHLPGLPAARPRRLRSSGWHFCCKARFSPRPSRSVERINRRDSMSSKDKQWVKETMLYAVLFAVASGLAVVVPVHAPTPTTPSQSTSTGPSASAAGVTATTCSTANG